MAYTSEQRSRDLPAMEGPCCLCDQPRHVTKSGEVKARCTKHWREQTAAMRKKARTAPRREKRECTRCHKPFEWSSMHPRQKTCSKSCYMAQREADMGEPRSAEYKREVQRRSTAKVNAAKAGITVEEYEQRRMGACEICQEADRFPLQFDHDHHTGLFRGFLCGHCNRLLGHAQDDVTILRAAMTYLERR